MSDTIPCALAVSQPLPKDQEDDDNVAETGTCAHPLGAVWLKGTLKSVRLTPVNLQDGTGYLLGFGWSVAAEGWAWALRGAHSHQTEAVGQNCALHFVTLSSKKGLM